MCERKMWVFAVAVLTCLGPVQSSSNESFPVLDLIKILKSETSENVSEICSEHLKDYLTGIMSLKPWALQMIDSITKFPDGILIGHFNIPGHFDECVNAVSENFSGKHCMANVKMKDQKEKILNVYQTLKENPQMSFTYGICIPSTCTAEDIENSIKSVEELNFIQVNVSETDCSTSEFRPFRTEDWVTVAVIAIISIVAVGSTVYDLRQRYVNKNSTPDKWTSFSIYSNWKHLFRISQSSSQLKCLHGIRFLSMSWVILCHCYVSYMFGAPINMFEIQKALASSPSYASLPCWVSVKMFNVPFLVLFFMLKHLKDKSFVAVSNGFVSVDSFFFLSGLLVCLVFFRDIAKKKTFDVPVAFIHRYLRLTPPFALLMLVQATIISRIGNGPFWNSRSDLAENGCRESWWTGILYLQNYIKPTSMCLGQAWYLSADMQMYWVSPLILYPILWFPSFAPFFLLLLVLAAAFTNFAIAFVNDFGPNFFFNLGPETMDQFNLEYAPFHTRMAPWVVGLATGYIICGIQAKKIRFDLPKPVVIVGWMAGISLLGGSIFGIIRFLSDEKFSTTEAAFYLAFHRVGWALGLAWVVIACVGGYGGPVNDILSLDFFQPLAKLSYCNFLIHMTLQNYRINSARTNQYIRHFDIVYAYFADIFISNLISIPVVLLFEFPFTNIDRHFIQKLVIFPLPKPKKEEKKEDEEVKIEKPVEQMEDLEKGKENPAFTES